MKVKFNHPPTGTSNPFWDFDPTNQRHYPQKTKGVYIYGLRLIVNGEYKFVPIVVGEGDLFKRLYKDHYLGKFKNPYSNLICSSKLKIGDRKELWNFSNFVNSHFDLQLKYHQILDYDFNTKDRFKFASKWPELIYFQDFRFYENKISPPFTIQNDIDIVNAVIELKNRFPYNNMAMEYTWKIITTLANFRKHFYFVYADVNNQEHVSINSIDQILLSESKAKLTEHIEHATKKALQTININTSAKDINRNIKIGIDLSEIENELVNVGEHTYGFPNYNKKLIIK